MKLSLRGASMLVLSLAAAVASGTAACADSEEAPFTPTNDAGDASSPKDERDGSAPEASVEAGTKRCSDHGFCRTELPPGQTLEGVWGDGTGVVWAVTAEGNVLRWDGNAWKVHASDLGALVAIWGSGPTDIWIAGDTGLHHGTGATSASLTFAPVTLPGQTARFTSVWGQAPGDIWAAGFSDDPDTGMTFGRLLHLASGSAMWVDVPLAPEMVSCSGVWGNAAVGVWAACSRPVVDLPEFTELVILRRHGGDDFDEVPMPVNPDDDPLLAVPGVLNGAVAVSASSIWIYGTTASNWPTCWHGTSADNGQSFTFTEARDGKPEDDPKIMSVYGTTPNDVWAVGEYGRARHWNGTTWSTVAITNTHVPIIDPLYGVWSGGPSEVWFVGKQIALRFDPTQEKDGGVQ